MKRSVLGPCGVVASIALSSAIVCFQTAAVADARVHDGLYFRGGVGLGFAGDSIKSDDVVVLGVVAGRAEGTATGFAGASELALGYSLSDGFVLGGGLYSAWIFSPKSTDAKVVAPIVGQVGGEIDFDASSFHVLGPFIDYYFDPRAGLHLQGGLGFAWMSLGDGTVRPLNSTVGAPFNSTGGGGFGFMAGFGDEWWVSDALSLGLLGRLTLGFMSGEDANGLTWNHFAYAPVLLFVATVN